MGILALVFQKPVLILGTSVVGSYQFFLGVDTFADTGFKDAMEKILSVRARPFESTCANSAFLCRATRRLIRKGSAPPALRCSCAAPSLH